MASRTISILVGREPRAFTQARTDPLLVTDTTTRVHTPGGGGPWDFTGTKYGFTAVSRSSENRRQSFDRVSPLLGNPKNYRFYWADATLSWSTMRTNSGSGMGTRLDNMDFVTVSNKMTPQNINTGMYDTTIQNFAAAATFPVIMVSPPHEPDVKNPSGGSGNSTTGTAAQYQTAMTRWNNLIKGVGNPLVKTALCMGYNAYSTRWPIWTPSVATSFDFFGLDPYRWDSVRGRSGTTYTHGVQSAGDVLTWIKNRYGWSNSNRIIVMETGHSTGDPSNPGVVTDSQAANWMDGWWDTAEADGVFAIQYFYNDNQQLITTASTNVQGEATPPYPLARAQWFAHSGLTDPGGY